MDWHELEIRAIERRLRRRPPPPGPVAFYGGSSIRLWGTLDDDFPGAGAVNLGFGGATLEACARHFGRLVAPCGPRAVVLYAGDNDLGWGRTPEDVLDAFRRLDASVASLPGDVPLAFLAIKPSPARWDLIGPIRRANALILDAIAGRPSRRAIDVHTPMLDDSGRPQPGLFAWDGLHLSPAGYRLWAGLIAEHGFDMSR